MIDYRDDDLVSAEEGARLLGVSPVTIRVWVSRGHVSRAGFLPGRGRKGSFDLFKVRDLRRCQEQRRRRADPKD